MKHNNSNISNCTEKQSLFARIKSSKKALIVCCAALLCAAVAATLAIILVVSDPIKNVFVTPKLDNEIIEEFDGEEKTSVVVKNKGNIDEFVRVTVVVNWKNEDGSVLAKTVDKDYYTLEVNTNAWTLNGKYWYHNKSVAKNKTTAEFLKSGTKVALTEKGKANVPEGYSLSVEILADAIQAEPADAIEEAWGLSAEDGAIVYEKGGDK